MLLSELCTRKAEESSSFELAACRSVPADVYERLVLGRKTVERAYNPKRMSVEGGSCKMLLPRNWIKSSATSLAVEHYLDRQERPQESSGRDNKSGPYVVLVQEDTSIFTKRVILHQRLNRDRHQLGNSELGSG